MTRSQATRGPGVYAHIEALGLKTYNDRYRTARAKFNYLPVKRLYTLEIPHYFGILCRDGGTVLSRDDPTLFDQEFDQLLQEYGPLIWPQPHGRNREHLCDAKAGTLYEADLIYPRDASILKNRLRALVLAKILRPGTDIQALIEKRHKDSHMRVLREAPNTMGSGATNPRAKCSNARQASRPTRVCHNGFSGGAERDASDSEDSVICISSRRRNVSDSEDSVICSTSRRRAVVETEDVRANLASVELRLYRKTSTVLPDACGPVKPYGPWFLTPDCTTANECFTRICEKIETDCSFMVFHFPEDMSMTGSVRLNRGAGDAEPTFQRIVEILQKAKKFPGEPRYRSLEVEVGLDFLY
ncbi:hypothetical protein BKA63DRAFT_489165 [Paraphoma chrysanthemicola]|nr:hypothetical protein BKA63DRAFT_489165 [Paraphoma chrysanthemicola]